jgi:hypothetical protein
MENSMDTMLISAGEASQNAPARLIVCERTGRWAAALRRALVDLGVRVFETRSFDACREELITSPASFVVFELGSDASPLLANITRQLREFPASRIAVAADRSQADYHALLCEAGAVFFLDSPRRIDVLAQLACRHLAQVPLPIQSLTERIWASLPWREMSKKRDR